MFIFGLIVLAGLAAAGWYAVEFLITHCERQQQARLDAQWHAEQEAAQWQAATAAEKARAADEQKLWEEECDRRQRIDYVIQQMKWHCSQTAGAISTGGFTPEDEIALQNARVMTFAELLDQLRIRYSDLIETIE